MKALNAMTIASRRLVAIAICFDFTIASITAATRQPAARD
jgi:hypothetical protein